MTNIERAHAPYVYNGRFNEKRLQPFDGPESIRNTSRSPTDSRKRRELRRNYVAPKQLRVVGKDEKKLPNVLNNIMRNV